MFQRTRKWSLVRKKLRNFETYSLSKEGKLCRKASNRFSQLLFQIDSRQLWSGSQPQSSIQTNHARLKSNADSRFKDFIKPEIF